MDSVFLASGVSTEAREDRGGGSGRPRPSSAAHEYEDAIGVSRGRAGGRRVRLGCAPGALAGEAWALQERGQVRDAMELLVRARELVERPEFSDVGRADVLFRLGVCRYKLSSISTAVALFDEALQLAERSGFPCGLLLSDILQWRSRCRRRLRDYVAAQPTSERAGARAGPGRRAAIARAYFQASPINAARGTTVLPWLRQRARSSTNRQRRAQRRRLHLMLGGLTLLLGDEEPASSI